MEKKHRCSACEGRLEPNSEARICRTCSLKKSSDITPASTSEIRREVVRGKAVLGLLS